MPVSPQFSPKIPAGDIYTQTRPGEEPGFAIYVHWPFCAHKCPYCDFNSYVATPDQEEWGKALCQSLRRQIADYDCRPVQSLFFGGGTPSLMAPQIVAMIIDQIAHQPGFTQDCEITLEANPSSSEKERFSAYHTAGINRLSLGVQALRDKRLQFLGRKHDVASASTAFGVARAIFDQVSFDLIYGCPGDNLAGWGEELREALSWQADHLSLYQLTIEPGTNFALRYRKGALIMPREDFRADLFCLTQEICNGASMPAYEISNHARAGFACQHNLVYWRYGAYLGVGPGAHGRVRKGGQYYATQMIRQPGRWISAILAGQDGLEECQILSPLVQSEEMMLMGLRLVEGVDLARYARLAGRPVEGDILQSLIAQNLVTLRQDRLSATACGQLLLNQILAQLLPD